MKYFKITKILVFIFALSSLNPVFAQDRSIVAKPSALPTLSVKTSARTAGAISSVNWNNKEFINTYDHDRTMQTTMYFDDLGDCYRVNEAGTKKDGTGGTSSSLVMEVKGENSTLRAKTQMAYWLEPNENYGKPCMPGKNESTAQNTKVRSDYIINKTLELGFLGNAYIMSNESVITVPEDRNNMVANIPKVSLNEEFNKFYSYDPATNSAVEITASTDVKKSDKPIIVSTADGNFALGVYFPKKTNSSNPAFSYSYMRSNLAESPSSMLSCQYDSSLVTGLVIKKGEYKFKCYMPIGTLSDVKTYMKNIYDYFQFPQNGQVQKSSCKEIKGWAVDPDKISQPIKVDFYVDGPLGSGTLIGSVDASQTNSEANTYLKDTLPHGFTFAMPAEFKSSNVRQVYAYGNYSNYGGNISMNQLQGSPVNISTNKADFNLDCSVTTLDLSIFLTHYNSTTAEDLAKYDLNGNGGKVGPDDLSILLSRL